MLVVESLSCSAAQSGGGGGREASYTREEVLRIVL